jgi:OOP family OmpA-OmpF porin
MKACKAVTSILGAAALALMVVQAWAADDEGWYAGISVGYADARSACDGVPVSCDGKDRSLRLSGGYQFTKNWAIEAAYVDLGKATASGTIGGVAVSASAKSRGLELSAVGSLPLAEGWSAYGKLGLFRWDVDVTASAVIPGIAAAGASASDSGVSATFGAGLQYDFTKQVGTRLGWQRYARVGDAATTGRSDVDVLGVGLQIRF